MVHPLYLYNFYCLLFPTDTIVFLSSFPLLLDLSTLLLAQMGSQVLPYVLALVLIPVYRIFEIQLNFKENQPEIDTHKVMYIEVGKSGLPSFTRHRLKGSESPELTPLILTAYRPESGDLVIFPTDWSSEDRSISETFKIFTMYKRVDKKVHPVSGTFPEEARVRRTIPEDPLLTLSPLPTKPPEFSPGQRLTQERMDNLDINHEGFLSKEEERLFQHVLRLNEKALAFEDTDRGTLKQSYFSDYIMPTVPHTPWEYRNIPIPPGILDKVVEVLKNKIDAGAYEPSQSSYRGRWFCVLKKNGALRIVHDLQPLNKVTIRDAGLLPIIDNFVEPFAGSQCYTVFDLFWGFDARIVSVKSRDMTAFSSPLGLLRLTALPTGYTNSPAEFQNCMVFILKDEIPHVANVFIDDLPIKGPSTQYLDDQGQPETLPDNSQIRRFIWEHANDVNRIMHKIECAGATFSAKKTQMCRPKVTIVGQTCSAQGREPDKDRVIKILDWPRPRNISEVRGFLGICGTVRIWIKDYSKIIRPLTELLHRDTEFEWTSKREETFEQLKKTITSAPILRPIDYKSDRPIYLSVDTSYIAVGFILSQEYENGKRRPARYGSIPMNKVESQYSQPKLELYGLYRALRHWSLHLIGTENRLRIEVDAKYIKGMINGPALDPKAPMNRWIQGILLFDFELIHVPAKDFKGPDGLSRRRLAASENTESDSDTDFWTDKVFLMTHIPHPEKALMFDQRPLSVMPYKAKTLPSADMNTGKENQNIQKVHHFLRTLELPIEGFTSEQARRHFLKKVTQFYIDKESDRMFKRNPGSTPQLVILNATKKVELITQAHDELGHKGEQVVYELLRARFYWPYQRSDVHFHLASCIRCQLRSKVRLEIPPTVSSPQHPFQKVYIDVMKMPESGGFSWVVSCKDDLTGAIEARALRNNQSKPMAKFF